MGTNYYAKINDCRYCGRFDHVHLGKASAGWKFSFQGSDTIRDFDQWKDLVRSASVITDEYGVEFAVDEMIDLAQNWQTGRNHALAYPGNDTWVDQYGYSFSGYDFS